jgi:hypothetical protein
MATQWQTFPIEFRGGLISNQSPLQQGTNAVGSATFLQNFEASKEGGYSKILGYTKHDSSAVPGSGPVLGVKVVNSSDTLAVRKDGSASKVYLSTGSGWTLKATSATAAGGKVTFENFDFSSSNIIVLVDGVNYPAVFDDTANTVTYMTSSDTSDVLAASSVARFKSAMFYAKGTNLIFTAPTTYNDFSVANGSGTLNIGDEIIGLKVFRDQLIIFGRNKIKRLSGNSAADYVVSPISENIGCIAGPTIQEVGGDLFFASVDGIRSLAATDRIGDFGLEIPSDPIAKNTYDFMQSASDFSSVVIREKAQYRIFAYNSSEQQPAAGGLLATKLLPQGGSGLAWAETKGIKAYVADSAYTDSLAEIVLFGNEDGYIYKLESGSSFDGSNISAIYESPFMPINDPQMRKSFYKSTFYIDPTGSLSFDYSVKYDFDKGPEAGVIQPDTDTVSTTGNSIFIYGNTSSVFNTATFGGSLDKVYTENIIGSGKTIALRIEDTSTNPTFTLDTVLLEFATEDRQ